MFFNKNGQLRIDDISDIEILLVNGLDIEQINNLTTSSINIDEIKLNLPSKYNYNDFKQMIMNKLNEYNNIYQKRIIEELIMFEYCELTHLACIVWYITDYMNATQQLYGLGRGSSCSIFCFYILKLHRVDCVKYNISYVEFFKKELPIK